MLLTRLKIAFDEQAQSFADQFPWLIIAFATMVVTCIVAYLILVITEYFLSPHPRRYYAGSRKRYLRSYIRLGFITFAIIVLAGGFWTAAQMFGLPFFSILLTYGLVTFILTYTFSIPLQNTGAFIFKAVTAKISEEDYIIVEGTRVQGTVIYIGILYTTLENEQHETIDVPSLVLMSNVIRHKRAPPEATATRIRRLF